MELKSKIIKEGNELQITSDNGFKAYFKGPNSTELLKNTREMLNMMNIVPWTLDKPINYSRINLVEEEEHGRNGS